MVQYYQSDSIKSKTNSYMSGIQTRYYQQLLWYQWANAALPRHSGPNQVMAGALKFTGESHSILAFLAEMFSFATTMPLPYAQYWVPQNTLSWHNADVGKLQVNSGADFYAVMLSEVYGAQSAQAIEADSAVILIDPKYLTPQQLTDLAQIIKGHPVIVVQQNRQPLPEPLRTLSQAYFYQYPHSGPLVLPAVREAMRHTGAQHFTLAGGGPRLFTSVIQAADNFLMFCNSPQTSYSARQAVVNNAISWMPRFSKFDQAGWFPGQCSMHEALLFYLASQYNCVLDDTDDQSKYLGYEFFVHGYRVPLAT